MTKNLKLGGAGGAPSPRDVRTVWRDRRGLREVEVVLPVVEQDVAHFRVFQPPRFRLPKQVDDVRSTGAIRTH